MNLSPESHEQTPEEIEITQETQETREGSPQEKKEMSVAFREFSEKVASLATPEEKIGTGLQFMKTSISQDTAPNFRDFWDARKTVLAFFKENINPAIRSKLWNEYVELTVEARRLKEILEEQSAFAVEQIDLAITALEGDVQNFNDLLATVPDIVFSEQTPTILAKFEQYNRIQRELNLFNTLASRLNGLRKEVIKTDMRMRYKTKFFKRLSQVGDHIFPKRKELIEKVSAEFQSDIDQFILAHFKGDEIIGAPYYALREEIKALQGTAKLLTLSSGVFNRTRVKLSECWDKIKVLEKEHKKEIFAKKQQSQENRKIIEKKIEELEPKAQEMSLQDLNLAIEEISKEMKEIELHRSDVFFLRDQFARLRAPYIAAQEEKAKAIEEAEKEKIRIRQEKVNEIKDLLSNAIQDEMAESADLEKMVSDVKDEIKSLGLTKTQIQIFDRLFRQIKDRIVECKEKALMQLSDDDREALNDLRSILEQKKERRQEIKDQIEFYRKEIHRS